MLASEMADVLVLNAALDRFASASRVSAEQAVAWTAVVRHSAAEMTPDEAKAIIIDFYGTAGESLTPYLLVEAWRKSRRLLPDQVAADVRVARRLSLVAADWPEGDPLPADVKARLADARTRRQEVTAEIAARPAGMHGLPELVSKRVPS